MKAGACPDENALSRVVSGALTGDERAAIERHIDTCDPCAELVAELARTWFDDAPPSVLACVGRYQVGPRIGAGGMGVVHAAHDPVLRRTLALKLILREGADDERLLREARAMARVAHTNVVGVHDAGRADDRRVFVAMELVRGPSLRRWLALSPNASWRAIVALFVQAGRGLAAAHAAGVVHRDFKPENVLVEPSDPPRARVTDFGLARPVHASDEAPSSAGGAAWLAEIVTREGGGTPAYVAPEQLEGIAGDARSDQYAFGVSLFEALWKRRPFAHARTIAELRVAMRTPVGRPKDGDVPAWVWSVVARALRSRPDDRFASMKELVDALEKGEGTSAEWLLTLHTVGLVFMACMHVVFCAFVLAGLMVPDDPTATSPDGRLDQAFTFWIAAAFVTGWLPVGIPIAIAGAYGMARRKRWAYVLATIYAIASLPTCLGTPYALFALLTLRRPTVRAALGRAPR